MTEGIDSEARSFPDLIARSAVRFADRDAVIDAAHRLSYADLDQQMRAATAAAAAAGIGPGDRVAIWAPNCVRWVVAALGVQACGAAIVPLSTRLRGEEAAYVIRASGARALFTVRGFLDVDYPDLLTSAAPDCILPTVLLAGAARGDEATWDTFLSKGRDVPAAEVTARLDAVGPDSVSDIMFTSGTTGVPKGVLTTHRQNLLGWRDYAKALLLNPDDRSLIVLPLSHNFGFKAGFVSSALVGAAGVMLDVFDLKRVLSLIESERITVLSGTPTLAQGVLDSPLRAEFDVTSLRKGTIAGSAIPVELIHRMRAENILPHVMSGYGLSECAAGVALSEVDDPPEKIATTCGRVRPHVQVRVIDDDGNEVPTGEPGEITVAAPTVMLGYYDMPAETEAALVDGWLRTGDIGTVDAEGYLRITDRKKDMFIVGGFNAYPAEIELALIQHPEIAEVAVVGVPDARMGEVGAAFVVRTPGSELDADTLTPWMRERLANYKVPRHVRFVDSLPRNSMLKVDKLVLRPQARALFAPEPARTESHVEGNAS
ncbi:AMP-binding protein [Sporichthya polymorpha]|uniref:AMP-binding protein n=1 Tax=Sporichthya polymorpha TaxID=35751 RepID=UPI001B7F85D0|nr:AMP-binding protein [Sporichthya polymorpha]